MTPYEEPGLTGLELWRGMSRGATLFQLRDHKQQYFAGLREFLIDLHRGEAQSPDRAETESLRQAAGFTRAILCGGEALHPLLEPILRAAPLPFEIEIDPAGPYAARRGALRIFESMRWQRGLALDLGQCQLKLITAGSHLTLPRDPALLPFGADALDLATGRERLRQWIAAALSRARAIPDGIVLALPVAITSDGVAQPATYPGLFGPLEPIFAGLLPCPAVVLNDAVLCAAGFPPRERQKTLVVTLGFGIGGALWQA